MKSYKIREFDKDQSRVFVEVTLDNGETQMHHLPVTYSYLVKTQREDGNGVLVDQEELVDATSEQFTAQIEQTIKEYEDSWEKAESASRPVSDELNSLLED